MTDLTTASETASPAFGTWQPIETAPKDETHVLIHENGYITQASYCYGEWWPLNNDPSDYWGGSWDPTHWMPLPPPPEMKP